MYECAKKDMSNKQLPLTKDKLKRPPSIPPQSQIERPSKPSLERHQCCEYETRKRRKRSLPGTTKSTCFDQHVRMISTRATSTAKKRKNKPRRVSSLPSGHVNKIQGNRSGPTKKDDSSKPDPPIVRVLSMKSFTESELIVAECQSSDRTIAAITSRPVSSPTDLQTSRSAPETNHFIQHQSLTNTIPVDTPAWTTKPAIPQSPLRVHFDTDEKGQTKSEIQKHLVTPAHPHSPHQSTRHCSDDEIVDIAESENESVRHDDPTMVDEGDVDGTTSLQVSLFVLFHDVFFGCHDESVIIEDESPGNSNLPKEQDQMTLADVLHGAVNDSQDDDESSFLVDSIGAILLLALFFAVLYWVNMCVLDDPWHIMSIQAEIQPLPEPSFIGYMLGF